jgi:hypothetical protein
MYDSDSLYHQLFSHPRMVEELLREFVPEPMAADLDFSGLQRVNTKFYTNRDSARRREGDVIWRLPTLGGSDLYLLLEFQSESDWRMAVRTQVYQGLLWQHVIDEKKLKEDALLPPLMPLVLYNGVYRWGAAMDLRSMISLSPDSALWPLQPRVRYHLLDVRAFTRRELRKHVNLATLLFRLEQQPSLEEIKDLADDLGRIFRQHPDSELNRLFTELVRQAYMRWGVTGPIPEDLLMFKSNLDSLGEVWKQQWRAEGEAKGLAHALTCLLGDKFGALTPLLSERISRADVATLDNWFKRAITASDLDSVFANHRQYSGAPAN